MIGECVREQDVLDAIATNRWPLRADEELRRHVAQCPICADLVEVVRPLLAEGEHASEQVRVPPAYVVWWRAQIRARNEATRAAAWPLTIAQGAAVATALAVAGGLVMTGWARPVAAVVCRPRAVDRNTPAGLRSAACGGSCACGRHLSDPRPPCGVLRGVGRLGATFPRIFRHEQRSDLALAVTATLACWTSDAFT